MKERRQAGSQATSNVKHYPVLTSPGWWGLSGKGPIQDGQQAKILTNGEVGLVSLASQKQNPKEGNVDVGKAHITRTS